MQSLGCDLLIVGGGIWGTLAAYLAGSRSGRKTVLAERERIGSGATRFSAGLISHFAASERHRDLAVRSLSLWRDLDLALPDLDLRPLPVVYLAREASSNALRERCFDDRFERVRSAESDRVLEIVPLRLPCGFGMFTGSPFWSGDVDDCARVLAAAARDTGRVSLFEGTEIRRRAGFSSRNGHQSTCGRRFHARQTLFATGADLGWCKSLPVVPGLRIRVKKVVSFLVASVPKPGAQVIYFFEESSFLMPRITEGDWVLSISSDVWTRGRVGPVQPTSEEFKAAATILRRYVPSFETLIVGSRCFWDAYAAERLPFFVPLDVDGRDWCITGGSGSGFRLGPALVVDALRAMGVLE